MRDRLRRVVKIPLSRAFRNARRPSCQTGQRSSSRRGPSSLVLGRVERKFPGLRADFRNLYGVLLKQAPEFHNMLFHVSRKLTLVMKMPFMRLRRDRQDEDGRAQSESCNFSLHRAASSFRKIKPVTMPAATLSTRPAANQAQASPAGMGSTTYQPKLVMEASKKPT